MAREDHSKFQSLIVQNGDIDIHLIHNGQSGDGNGERRISTDEQGLLHNDTRPVLLFLHGFPEYHGAWEQVLPLLAKDHLIIAPDQRGYNLSSAPQELSLYQTKLLVGDMTTLMDKLLPHRKYHLIGHDWGASIAYAIAIGQSDRISTLTIINGVHPVTFQRALSTDKRQAKASQYFHKLCEQDAAIAMSRNGFAKTFSMFEKFSSTQWLDERQKQNYLQAWSQPGRMNAMLNWYRASPMIVPIGDRPANHSRMLDADPAKFRIAMPHLVLWGMQDTALLPVARSGLEDFAPNLKIIELEDAGHWINHTHPDFIATHIRDFISHHNS